MAVDEINLQLTLVIVKRRLEEQAMKSSVAAHVAVGVDAVAGSAGSVGGRH